MRTSVDVSKHIDEMSSRLDAGHYLSVGYRNVGCPLSATASESIQAIESFPEHTQLSEVVRGIDILRDSPECTLMNKRGPHSFLAQILREHTVRE